MTETREYTKYDTFASVTYLVRLAQDAKIFKRADDKGEDVVLTFCDSNRIPNHEDMWVDARVAKFQADRAAKFQKGDVVQIIGKLRFKRQDDGTYRGKIYDAVVSSFVSTRDRGPDMLTKPDASSGVSAFD